MNPVPPMTKMAIVVSPFSRMMSALETQDRPILMSEQ
jgi:hypothetical protein